MNKILPVITVIALMALAIPSRAQITINIRYTGENGGARAYVKEMEESGIAARIRSVEGCLRYDYFFPADDPEGLLLIDEWADQEALNRYHSSPMMQEASALREKYGLAGRKVTMYKPIVPAPREDARKMPPDDSVSDRRLGTHDGISDEKTS